VNDRGVLNESTPDLKGINPEAITNSVNDILSCDLIPNEDDELQLIENDKEIFTWVETGVKIHQHRDKCLFCGEDYKTTRREKLISFFQTKQAELIDKIDQLIRDIQDYTKKVEVSRHPDNSLFQEFRTDYQQKYELQLAAWESLLNGLKIMVEAAEWKKSHLFAPYETKAAEVQGTNINLLIQDFIDKSRTKEDVIKNHNTRVANFDKAQKEAKEKILQHHIKSLLPKYKEHNEAVNAASAKFSAAKTEFDTLSQRIGTIKSELSNAKKGSDAINVHLSSMGHGHIRLEEAEGEIGYALTRMKKRAKNLSEGEKTAVAVAFFINSLKDSNFKLKDSILVIDDPVSSLDANVLFFVFSMIKEYTSDAAQLFILTHNHQFFVRVLKWKGHNSNECSCYEIKREINHSEERLNSSLSPLDGYLIKRYNEYHHLFFLLYSCCKSANSNLASEDSRFTHLNIARRVLECFFGFWYPASNSLESAIEYVKKDLEEKDSDNFESLCQSAYIVTNMLSHGDVDAVMGVGEVVNSETPDVTIRNCLKIIEMLVPEHYKQMSVMCDNGGDYSTSSNQDAA
jgi:wobble nucleotide-excising tRNase